MMSFLFLPLLASADLALSGKVLSLQKNPLKNNFLVRFDTVSETLEVDRGPLYSCLKSRLTSQENVVFSFDPKTLKIRACGNLH
nr:hypothetical protein [uncultured Bdellovibrio sp.]